MKAVTGAILILSTAVLLVTIILVKMFDTASVPFEMLLIGLAAATGIAGTTYLVLGSVDTDKQTRRFQFSVKGLLLLAIVATMFFAGLATGLKKSQAEIERLEAEAQNEDPVRTATRLGFQVSEISVNGQPVGFPGAPGRIDDQVRQVIRLYWMGLPKGERNVDKVQDEVQRSLDRAVNDLRANVGEFCNGEDEHERQSPNTPQPQSESPPAGSSSGSVVE